MGGEEAELQSQSNLRFSDEITGNGGVETGYVSSVRESVWNISFHLKTATKYYNVSWQLALSDQP